MLIVGLQLHDKFLGRILLALLYTLLHEGELRSAVELTELLIRQQDARSTLSVCSQDTVTKTNILSLLQKVSNPTTDPSTGREVHPECVQPGHSHQNQHPLPPVEGQSRFWCSRIHAFRI